MKKPDWSRWRRTEFNYEAVINGGRWAPRHEVNFARSFWVGESASAREIAIAALTFPGKVVPRDL
jgi:hypothetical protein